MKRDNLSATYCFLLLVLASMYLQLPMTGKLMFVTIIILKTKTEKSNQQPITVRLHRTQKPITDVLWTSCDPWTSEKWNNEKKPYRLFHGLVNDWSTCFKKKNNFVYNFKVILRVDIFTLGQSYLNTVVILQISWCSSSWYNIATCVYNDTQTRISLLVDSASMSRSSSRPVSAILTGVGVELESIRVCWLAG